MRKIKKRAPAGKITAGNEIRGIMDAATSFYDRSRTVIVSSVIAVLALVVLAGGYALYQARSERAASAMLAKAYELYGAEQPDHQKAFEAFRKIREEHSRTFSAAVAQYYAGNALVSAGRTEDAIAEYELFVKRYSGEKDLLGLVYQRMGFAYAGKGDRDQAIRAFTHAEELLGPGIASRELARIYEQAGKTDEAGKKYQELARSLPGTSLGIEAKARVPEEKNEAPAAEKKPAQ